MPDSRRGQIRRVLVTVLGYNLFVLGIKLAVGLGTGSLAVLADALHSLTDSLSNVLGLVVNAWAKPEPDRQHPYGHQKFEAIGALAIAALLGITCFEVLRQAGERLLGDTPPPEIGGLELALLVVVLAVNLLVGWYEQHQGTLLDSPILQADAADTLSDGWINLAVLVGLLGVMAGWTWLDAGLAIPVGLLVLHSGWRILTTNLPWLVDEMAIAPEAIAQVVGQVAGVVECHQITSRGVVGRQVFIELHLVVAPPDLVTAHNLSDQVEALLQQHYGPAGITIHVEPTGYEIQDICHQPVPVDTLESNRGNDHA
ncbi:Cation efflux protein [Gloeomargarita lithophora Alchichica-D10]|uniref:Cation efflux protein n=1 Tax=Gloeomargarita lithophora Alchichica-D10 TaxID=1188229 RepID=A0A1J0AFM1_9CYAN|nr:cation diffusion facilitator family transporter [Gloeomargarita lithophora]APB34712.1 Cation efflux protein [Gloeomargarita lithophora Alchichica-D10]